MTIEKKTLRSDIPGHQSFLSGYGTNAASEEQRRLIVGREITLNGTICACDHLVVEGMVEAAGFTARRMDILETGLFTGAADVDDAVIGGRFEGRLTVPGRLVIKSTGRVYGEVQYGAVEIESGAVVDGHMSQLPQAVAEKTPEPQPLKAPATPSNVEALFPADEEEEDGGAQAEKSPRVFRRAVGY